MSEELRRGVRLRLTGRVQGVGFRYFVQRRAEELGIVGWVRNAADGSVEAEAWGDGDALGRFKEELRRGPSYSQVTGLEERELETAPARGRFEIVH